MLFGNACFHAPLVCHFSKCNIFPSHDDIHTRAFRTDTVCRQLIHHNITDDDDDNGDDGDDDGTLINAAHLGPSYLIKCCFDLLNLNLICIICELHYSDQNLPRHTWSVSLIHLKNISFVG